ncbi:peptidyl-prolyl cis-trans isomerase, FKBP-type [Ostertagia ostertagi]
MQIPCLFLIFGLGLCAFAQEKKLDKLQIGVKKRVEPCEMKSRKGDVLHIQYVGRLPNGTEFTRNEDLVHKLGRGQVIRGWDQGLMDMCVGERRTLTVSPRWAYEQRISHPKIPGIEFFWLSIV